jgi:hypothetical protein
MTSAPSDLWHEANQRYLSDALAVVRGALQRHITCVQGGPEVGKASVEAPMPPSDAGGRGLPIGAIPAPPALETLCATFCLSPFERDTLLLCAGMELDASFAGLCATAQGDPQRAYPTFSLALATLPEAHWSALTPAAPLRHWRLVEVGAGSALTLSPLRIDERVLHYLAGVSHPDERLAGLVDPVPQSDQLVPSHQALADQLVGIWSQAKSAASPPCDGVGRPTPGLPVIQLCGSETAGKRSIAAAACEAVGLRLSVVAADALPVNPGELETLLRLWEREAALTGNALLLDCDDLDVADCSRTGAVARLIERAHGVLLVASRERRPARQRPLITLEVRKPTPSEQRTLWRGTLGQAAHPLNGQIEFLASHFDVSAQTIRAASAEALGRLAGEPAGTGADGGAPSAASHELGSALWHACRVQARPRLDNLAQRIESEASWDDLVLPEGQRLILRDIAAHVKQRATVYESWGFAARGARGLGISALFAGVSGTGKTLAADVLAHELRLDLYRIDLSSVVSKYIGETEKNLGRVFEAAEEGGAVLLFDEADALFGKRSEVKDSHDRYANIEVSYLLQRMECYRGLAILTTNLKSAIDTAFLRRIRFIVQFPFPDAAQRAEIWRRIFPPDTPTEGLEIDKLAQLTVSGGHIRNAALNAAFLAAAAGEPVRMTHLLRAAQSEYAKLEKTLTDAEVAGWV